MFDWDAEDRTEQPTPERREEAKRQGRTARSRDLVAGASLLGVAMLFAVVGPWFFSSLRESTRSVLGEVHAAGREFDIALVRSLALRTSAVFAALIVPVLACGVLGATVANLAQGTVALRTVGIEFSRLHPLSALRRVLSARNLARAALLAGKVALVSAIFAKAILDSLGDASAQMASETIGSWEAWWRQGVWLVIRASVALVVFGLFEYGLERWWLELDLRMTRAEREEETARLEGKREYKSARRKAGTKILNDSIRSLRGIGGVDAS